MFIFQKLEKNVQSEIMALISELLSCGTSIYGTIIKSDFLPRHYFPTETNTVKMFGEERKSTWEKGM